MEYKWKNFIYLFFFARANLGEVEVILKILAPYQEAYGQMVNLDI